VVEFALNGASSHLLGGFVSPPRGDIAFFALEFKLVDAPIPNQYNRGIPSSSTRTYWAIRIAILSELTGSAFRASGASLYSETSGFLK
jgi:hypothetical protein